MFEYGLSNKLVKPMGVSKGLNESETKNDGWIAIFFLSFFFFSFLMVNVFHTSLSSQYLLPIQSRIAQTNFIFLHNYLKYQSFRHPL